MVGDKNKLVAMQMCVEVVRTLLYQQSAHHPDNIRPFNIITYADRMRMRPPAGREANKKIL